MGYQGYDALLPFYDALERRYFPYTPSWHALAGLNAANRRLLDEGLDSVLARHADVAAHCRRRVQALGMELFPRREEYCSPTVTAVKVPGKLSWGELDRRLRRRGVAVGGSYGPLAGKVFRLGHMGTQADRAIVDAGLDALEEALKEQ